MTDETGSTVTSADNRSQFNSCTYVLSHGPTSTLGAFLAGFDATRFRIASVAGGSDGQAEIDGIATPKDHRPPKLAAEDRLQECDRNRPGSYNAHRGQIDVFWVLNLFFTDGVSIKHHEHLELRHVRAIRDIESPAVHCSLFSAGVRPTRGRHST